LGVEWSAGMLPECKQLIEYNISMISVKNLTKVYKTPVKSANIVQDFFHPTYKSYTAVKDVSFEIGENELIGFIGPNGAGKTTTLKMLSGILFPTKGSIDILGYTPFDKDPKFLKQIGFVMGQKNQLLWDLPAMDTFRVNKEIYDIEDKEFKKTVHELMEMLDVKSFIDQPIKTLSLGQRMRTELIASLLHKPRILFLDEPTIGLDIFAQSAIRNFIQQYQQQYRSTIILTSHYMQDVQQLAKRVILIDKGTVVYDDALDKLIEKYSQEKTITITLDKKLEELPSVIKKYDHEYIEPELKVSVKKNDLPKFMSQVLEQLDYSDVTIENETIEDVIKKSFKKS
jgi:ABC-2 type transport system ATP-binding protein